MKFGGQVIEGQLKVWNNPGLKDWIRSLNGKDVLVTVAEYKRKGSKKTHAYYRGYILPEIHRVYKEAGNELSVEKVHELLKFRFMLKDEISEDGELLGQYIPSSADFSQEEWNDYLEKIKLWAAETLGLVLLDPNQQAKMEI